MASNVREIKELILKISEEKSHTEKSEIIQAAISQRYKENAYAQILKKAIQCVQSSHFSPIEKLNLLHSAFIKSWPATEVKECLEKLGKAIQLEDSKAGEETLRVIEQELLKLLPTPLFEALHFNNIISEATQAPIPNLKKNKLIRYYDETIKKYFSNLQFYAQINHAFLIIALSNLNKFDWLSEANLRRVNGFDAVHKQAIIEYFKLSEDDYGAFLSVFSRFRHHFGFLAFFAAASKDDNDNRTKKLKLLEDHFRSILTDGLQAHFKRRDDYLAKQLNLSEHKELTEFFDLWRSEGGAKSRPFSKYYNKQKVEGWTIEETADFWTMFIRGTDAGSCHSMENGNPGSIEHTITGARLITIKNNKGRAVLRWIMEIVVDNQDQPSGIYLIMMEGSHDGTHKYLGGLYNFARERAEAYKLPLYSYGGKYTKFPNAVLSNAHFLTIQHHEPLFQKENREDDDPVSELFSPNKERDNYLMIHQKLFELVAGSAPMSDIEVFLNQHFNAINFEQQNSLQKTIFEVAGDHPDIAAVTLLLEKTKLKQALLNNELGKIQDKKHDKKHERELDKEEEIKGALEIAIAKQVQAERELEALAENRRQGVVSASLDSARVCKDLVAELIVNAFKQATEAGKGGSKGDLLSQKFKHPQP